MKDLLPLTGYIRGGCSPIGMKKAFPTIFHTTALDHKRHLCQRRTARPAIRDRPGRSDSFHTRHYGRCDQIKRRRNRTAMNNSIGNIYQADKFRREPQINNWRRNRRNAGRSSDRYRRTATSARPTSSRTIRHHNPTQRGRPGEAAVGHFRGSPSAHPSVLSSRTPISTHRTTTICAIFSGLPCRLHIHCKIRPPRPSRRRTIVGTRNDSACRSQIHSPGRLSLLPESQSAPTRRGSAILPST